jgi:hypothetical protein
MRTKTELAGLASKALAAGYYSTPEGLRIRCPLCPEQATGRREYRWYDAGPRQPYSRINPDTGKRQRFGQETTTQALRRIILAHLTEAHREEG